MLRSTTPHTGFRTPGTIDLEISNPVILLNEIAHRYESTERILMEYVDNALDDAEALFQENHGSYPYPIQIHLQIDSASGEISILDNCRGMTRDQLERVVRNVGESEKLGLPWVNGRFGFGVHAFRAAAQTIRFQSKHALSSHHILELHRDQLRGIHEAIRTDERFPTANETGTWVTISNFDRYWMQGVSADSLRAEIERHFEQILARPGLTISVGENDLPPQLCVPFDYRTISGVEITRHLEIKVQERTIPVEIFIKGSQMPYPTHRVAFFSRGRRIAALAEVKSFLRKSTLPAAVWDHPHLIGIIEVGELIQPKLFRDDFIRSRERQLLYEAITALEPEIRRVMQPIAKDQHEHSLERMEDTLKQALQKINALPAPAVRFASSGTPDTPAAEWKNEQLSINTDHPFFRERSTLSKDGLPHLSDRLNAYLAGLLSVYDTRWRDPALSMDWTTDQYLNAQVNYIFQLETALRQQHREAEKMLHPARS